MGRYILSLLFVLTLSATSYSQKKDSSKLIASCCDGDRGCTGSSSCSACTNCSGCRHCADNGGSCGVCSGGSSSSFTSTTKKKRKAKTSQSYSSRSSSSGFYSSTAKPELLFGAELTVKTTILNLRSGPGKDYSVVAILEKGDKVRCLETSSAEWIKVEVVDRGIEGYVYSANLIK